MYGWIGHGGAVTKKIKIDENTCLIGDHRMMDESTTVNSSGRGKFPTSGFMGRGWGDNLADIGIMKFGGVCALWGTKLLAGSFPRTTCRGDVHRKWSIRPHFS